MRQNLCKVRQKPCGLLVILAFTGCAETTTKTEAERPAPQTATTPAEPVDQTARVGDSITLQGNNEDLRVRVKLLRIRRNIPAGPYDSVDGKLIGLELLLTNVGDATYDDSPSNGARLISRSDREFDPAFLTGGPCELWAGVTIAPGSKRRGCLAFDVPKTVKAKTFQFSLDSGFGPESGEWDLRR